MGPAAWQKQTSEDKLKINPSNPGGTYMVYKKPKFLNKPGLQKLKFTNEKSKSAHWSKSYSKHENQMTSVNLYFQLILMNMIY